jgi:citrate/tricarballylate utilization protein
MPAADLMARGSHVMTVCNACRYCEQYCPVFPAMELRQAFAKTDLQYLANLCHNCGECLYACQYAPPHEFAINVPRTLAEIRLQSYEECCWPRPLAAAFRRQGLLTAIVLAAVMSAVIVIATEALNPQAFAQPITSADFYAVVPHGVMISLFGAVFAFAVAALGIGVRRFWSAIGRHGSREHASGRAAFADVLSLRHLHATGVDCTTAEETRRPWRRWFHHCTFYGFMLCFASTSVAAVYHSFFDWRAPYAYTSVPVVLGATGGLALLIGTVGLLVVRTRRDPALGDPAQRGLDDALIVLLFVTSLTGLILLVLRHEPAMAALLAVHLGAVLALFVMLPYSKFVHGLYRAAALVKYHGEQARSG